LSYSIRNVSALVQGDCQLAKILELRCAVDAVLMCQGFIICGDGTILPPDTRDKVLVRQLHAHTRIHRIELAARGLKRHQPRLLEWFANGSDVVPEKFACRLVEVQPGSEEELVFRYARLLWSVPVSAGYGRRLRFLVLDRNTEKLVGIIGLGDPVFALAPRDHWIGWTAAKHAERLKNVMDAFVLGAVPPYSELLAGKLVAALVASGEVNAAYTRKYAGKQSRISKQTHCNGLAAVTTMSALGRSSIYNRLKYGNRVVFERLGETSGSGEFHLSNGVYVLLQEYANRYHIDEGTKRPEWGGGWRSRRDLLKKVLPDLGYDQRLLYHGIHREIYGVQTGIDSLSFLRGDRDDFCHQGPSASELSDWFRSRWMLGRAVSRPEYVEHAREALRVWGEGGLLDRLRMASQQVAGLSHSSFTRESDLGTGILPRRPVDRYTMMHSP
jgi:hypothetical protein